ncbi:hypothetical protein Q3G72_027275 [Acer saccharum]|nr:hypothetical protein Q3G72_027275 [Acer saccharum]
MEIESSSSSAITLRPFKLSDVDDFMIWAGDDQVMRHLRWNIFTSKEEAFTYIKDDLATTGVGLMLGMLWHRSSGVRTQGVASEAVKIALGEVFKDFPEVVRLQAYVDVENKASQRVLEKVGFLQVVEFWGQGIATKAVKIALSEVSIDFPEVVRLQAYVDVQNKASQRVLEKVGFLQEGLLRKYCYLKGQIKDLNIYSFLLTDSSNIQEC